MCYLIYRKHRPLNFIGLRLTTGVEGVLLINTEAVFTAILAFMLFKLGQHHHFSKCGLGFLDGKQLILRQLPWQFTDCPSSPYHHKSNILTDD